jgi:hypothetical protein
MRLRSVKYKLWLGLFTDLPVISMCQLGSARTAHTKTNESELVKISSAEAYSASNFKKFALMFSVVY